MLSLFQGEPGNLTVSISAGVRGNLASLGGCESPTQGKNSLGRTEREGNRMFYIAATALCVAAGLGAYGLYKDAVKASAHRHAESKESHPVSRTGPFEHRDIRNAKGRPLEGAPQTEKARETSLLS